LKRNERRGKRIFIVGIVFSLVFSAIVGRLIYVMAINGSNYKTLALLQQTKI